MITQIIKLFHPAFVILTGTVHPTVCPERCSATRTVPDRMTKLADALAKVTFLPGFALDVAEIFIE
jgi:hypothetical protein